MVDANRTFVIVGGGLAGAKAAETLRSEGFTGRVILIGDERDHPYERPPLSKGYLAGKDERDSAFVHEPAWYARADIELHLGQVVTSVDRAGRSVQLGDNTVVHYDKLLLATGAEPRRLDIPGTDLVGVHHLRRLAHADRLRNVLSALGRDNGHLVIAGGGWIGLEIAASARKSGVAVTLFEQQPALCMRSVSGEVSQRLEALHREQGVDIRTGCGALELEDDNGLPVIHCDGQREIFDAVVVGIGVDLNLELARDAGLKTGRGIVVDAQGRTSDPYIFAAGDVAQHHHYGLCIQSWAFAQNQAVATAKAMLNPDAPGYDDAPWLWSDQYQHNIQILGIPQPGSRTVVREEALYFSLDDNGRLTQLVAFNDARTVKLAKRWMAAGRDLSDVPLGDPAFSLMSLR